MLVQEAKLFASISMGPNGDTVSRVQIWVRKIYSLIYNPTWISLWIKSWITRDNSTLMVDNSGINPYYVTLLSMLMHREARTGKAHIHISTEHAPRLLVDFRSKIRYTGKTQRFGRAEIFCPEILKTLLWKHTSSNECAIIGHRENFYSKGKQERRFTLLNATTTKTLEPGPWKNCYHKTSKLSAVYLAALLSTRRP